MLCSIGAKGMYLHLLLHMSRHDGNLVDNDGSPMELERIFRLYGLGTSEGFSECHRYIDELMSHNIIEKSRNGVMFCRRMVEDAALSKKRMKSGRLGGQASSKSNVDGKDNGDVQIPQDRPVHAR